MEHALFLDNEFKSVRFDVYASDEEEVSYDVEMQNDDTKNLPKRCRYYQAELDVTSLRPGEDYQQLKPGYIIFFCSFDPFGKGRYQYVFEEYCREADILLGDETQKIFLNTNGTDTENVAPELLHLFEYLKQSTEEVAVRHRDEKILKIHERVKYLKRDRKLEAVYMTMEEYIHQEAERRAKPMAESMAKPMAKAMVNEELTQYIFTALSELGTLPKEARERIAGQRDEQILLAWIGLAMRSDSIDEFLSNM
ncbi:MAG: Rpn family recombination-promoting nuclease/putative transposase [Roseburia hominis]